MLYSVFNWNTLQYDYYQSADGVAPGIRALPRRKFFSDGDGVALEDVLPLLPADAIKVGTGEAARGRVAVRGRGGGGGEAAGSADSLIGLGADAPTPSPFFVEHPWLSVGAVVGGTWLAWKLLLAGARRL